MRALAIIALAAISADGRYVVFAIDTVNLAAQDNNGFEDVFLHDRVLRTTRAIFMGPNGQSFRTTANGASYRPKISADGNHIAFISEAQLYGINHNDNITGRHIYLQHRETRANTRVTDQDYQLMASSSDLGSGPPGKTR